MFSDCDEIVAAPAFAGQRSGEARGLHTRKRADSGEELLKEGDLLRRLLVVHVGKTEA